jgi:hypothetical protein
MIDDLECQHNYFDFDSTLFSDLSYVLNQMSLGVNLLQSGQKYGQIYSMIPDQWKDIVVNKKFQENLKFVNNIVLQNKI